MKEIEVKAKIKNLSELLKSLKNLGILLSPPVVQIDRIFISKGATQPTRPGQCALRIREQNGTYLFTVKQTITNDLDCIEKEIEVTKKQANMLLESFPLMGFEEVHTVKKSRQKGKHGEYEICIDDVETLGQFIEVEKLTEEDNGEKIQEELFQFLETLGVKRQDRVLHGYDVLMKLKNKQL